MINNEIESLQIETIGGRLLNARIVTDGQSHTKAKPRENDSIVEFWDATNGRAQFVADFYLSTLRNCRDLGRGLCLNGDVPAWTITARDAYEIVEYSKAGHICFIDDSTCFDCSVTDLTPNRVRCIACEFSTRDARTCELIHFDMGKCPVCGSSDVEYISD